LHRRLGVLYIIVEEMMDDVTLFLEYYLIIFLAFSFAFVGMGKAGLHTYHSDVVSYDGVFTPAGWSLYGWVEPQRMQSPVSTLVLFSYVFLSNVTLVNVLIAMFSDTYARVVSNSEVEYNYKRFQTLYFYEHVMLSTPPLLNMPVILWQAWRHARDSHTEAALRSMIARNSGKSARTTGPSDLTAREVQQANAALNRLQEREMATLPALAQAQAAMHERLEDGLESLSLRLEQGFAEAAQQQMSLDTDPSTDTAIAAPPAVASPSASGAGARGP